MLQVRELWLRDFNFTELVSVFSLHIQSVCPFIVLPWIYLKVPFQAIWAFGFFDITHDVPRLLCFCFMIPCNKCFQTLGSNTNLFVVIISQRKGKCPLRFFFFFNLSRPWRADSSCLFWSRFNQEINTAIRLNLGNHTVAMHLLPLSADVDRDSELGGGVVLKRRNKGLWSEQEN